MLINCVVYQNGEKLADIGVDAISDYLDRPDCFVWVALRDATEAELQAMQGEFGLHELAVEDALRGHQRPKIDEYGDTIFCVVHTLELDATDALRIGELSVFAGRNFVLSVRNRSQYTLLSVRERAEREPHLLRHGAGFVLYALMDAVVDRYFPIIESLEDEVEAVESRIFDITNQRSNMEQLYALKQRITMVKHVVTPLLESAGKLTHGRVPRLCEANREYFRDVFDHLTRINSSLDRLRETIATATQVSLSMVMIDEAVTTKRLAAYAGIFAAATALVGVWGMNFKHMPELEWQWGYPAALATIAAVCGLVYWRFKRAGWV